MVLNMSQVDFSQLSLQHFSLADFWMNVKPLLGFIIGMAIYGVFIFKFYRFLAKRDVLELETHKYYEDYEGLLKKMLRSLFYVLENLVLIPLLVFFWFAVLASLLILLSKQDDPGIILLTAISIVAAVRITSYYNENLSQDLAKLIPFALLGVFLVDISYFSPSQSWEVAKEIPSLWQSLIYYLIFVTCLEFIMRVIHGISTLFMLKELAKDENDLKVD